MANSCHGDERTWFLWLAQWSQALCQGNPTLHSRKNSAWFPLPAQWCLLGIDRSASREVTYLRIRSVLLAELRKMKPACQGNVPRTKAWTFLPHQGPGGKHLCSNANSCFLGFSILKISMQYHKTGSLYFQITIQSCWHVLFLQVVNFIKGYSLCLDSFSSSRPPLPLMTESVWDMSDSDMPDANSQKLY